MSAQILYYSQATPLGSLRLAANNAGLVEAVFLDSPARNQEEVPHIANRHYVYTKYRRHVHKDLEAAFFLEDARRALEQYFHGDTTALARVQIAPHGTDFQKSIWSMLRKIPFGSTRTYSELAAAIGRPAAVRAAGTACKRNPLILFVPCHRIIGKDRSLTGFAGGIARKAFLLQHEGQGILSDKASASRHQVIEDRQVA